jgi:cell division protein FtsQ
MTGLLTGGPAGAAAVARRPRLIVVVAGALALVVLLVYLVAFSPVLGVRTVTVRGLHTLDAASVRSAADIPHGAPLIRLDTGAVRHRVEALPVVASARVDVSYPGTVTITIVERIAVAYTDDGAAGTPDRYSVLDRTGDQFAHSATMPANLPRIEVPSGSAADPAGQAAATVAGALSPTVLALLSAVKAESADSVTLLLRDGRTVKWGAPWSRPCSGSPAGPTT